MVGKAFNSMMDGVDAIRSRSIQLQNANLINNLSDANVQLQQCFDQIEQLKRQNESLELQLQRSLNSGKRISGRLSNTEKGSDSLDFNKYFLIRGVSQTYCNKYHPMNTPWSIVDARSYNLVLFAGFAVINDLLVGVPHMLAWTTRAIKHLRSGGTLPSDFFELLEKEAYYHTDLALNVDVWDKSLKKAKEMGPHMVYADSIDTWPTEECIQKFIPFFSYMKIDKEMNETYNGQPFDSKSIQDNYQLTPLTDVESMDLCKIMIPNRMPLDGLMPDLY